MIKGDSPVVKYMRNHRFLKSQQACLGSGQQPLHARCDNFNIFTRLGRNILAEFMQELHEYKIYAGIA